MFIIKKLWNKIKKLPRKAERLLGILGEILWILFQKAGRILKKGLQKIPRNPIVVVIGVIIIYLIVTAGLYFSSEQIESYQVTSGTLEKNPVYTALAIREEKVVNASQDGYLRYLRKEGSNVEKNGNVYAVGDSEIQIAKYALDETQKSKIKNAAEAFSGTFDSSDFADTYSLKYESNGTIRMLRVLPAIFEALDAGSTLFIDEIENGLHPNLVKLLAGLFNSNESNPHHAQLICTTHDTLLLDGVRRDQVWFTDKNQYGETSMCRLSDYPNVRSNDNIAAKYLQGVFGAIPNTQNL